MVFGEQDWIGIGRPVQVGGSVLGVTHVCERVRVCHNVYAPSAEDSGWSAESWDGDLTAVDSN